MKRTRDKVLVFEDTDQDFELIRKAFQAAGYQVVRAKKPEEFHDKAPFDEFVVVLVDLFLGKGGNAEKVGIELAREIKQKNPSLPVIVASNQEPSRNDVAEAFRAGAWDYVDKQDLLRDLSGTLKRVLESNVDDEARAEEQFPLPMAFLYRSFRRTLATPKRRLERMIELFEVTLKLTTYILLSAKRTELPALLPVNVRAGLERPSLGHFTRVLSSLTEVDGFVQPLSKITRRPTFRQICQDLVGIRNEYIGHGVTQANAVYERLLRDNVEKMMELLHMLSSLRQWKVVKPNSSRFLNDGYEHDLLVLQGSNPEAPTERIQTQLELRPTDHVHLVDEHFTESLDLFPWCQYLVCEQVCLSEKLFVYRLCREGEIWALDHVYGHAIKTRTGYQELMKILDPMSDM